MGGCGIAMEKPVGHVCLKFRGHGKGVPRPVLRPLPMWGYSARLMCERTNVDLRQKGGNRDWAQYSGVLLGLVWGPGQGRLSLGQCLGFLFNFLSP